MITENSKTNITFYKDNLDTMNLITGLDKNFPNILELFETLLNVEKN